MNRIIFKLIGHGYSLISVQLDYLHILANYLTDDFGYNDIRFNSWMNWFNDEKYTATSSDATCTMKVDDDIEICSIFDEDFTGPFFQMNKVKFIKFLRDWRDLTRLNPQTIIITYHDDGTLTLEGRDFPH